MADDKAKPTAGTSTPDKKEGDQKPVDTAAQEDAAKERAKTGGYQ